MRQVIRFLSLFVVAVFAVANLSTPTNAQTKKSRTVPLHALYVNSDLIVSGSGATLAQFPHGGRSAHGAFPWQLSGRQEIILNINSVIKGTAPSQLNVVGSSTSAAPGEFPWQLRSGERGTFYLYVKDGAYHLLAARASSAADSAALSKLHEIYTSGYDTGERVKDWLIARATDPRTRADGAYDLQLFLNGDTLDAGSSMDPNGNDTPCANGDQGSACDPNGGGGRSGYLGSGTRIEEGSHFDPNGRDGRSGYIGSGFKSDDGPDIDPDGAPRQSNYIGPGSSGDQGRTGFEGSGIDPHGRGVKITRRDEGYGLDPHGKNANRGTGFSVDETCHLDPNGGCGNMSNSRGTMDPDGKPVPATNGANLESGPRMDDNGTGGRGAFGVDPNGVPRKAKTKNTPKTEAGWQMDPDGRNGTDGGPEMDPNGKPVAGQRGAEIATDNKLGATLDPIGAKGYGMDPNGRDSGSCIDPYGQPCSKNSANTETGVTLDPWGRPAENGSCIDPQGQSCAKANRSSFIDPNGKPEWGVTIDPNGAEYSAHIDPNGRFAARGDYTMCIDPNGSCAARFSAAQKQKLAEAFLASNDPALLRVVALAFKDRELENLACVYSVTFDSTENGVSEWESEVVKRGNSDAASRVKKEIDEWDEEVVKRGAAILATFKTRVQLLAITGR